MGYDPSTDFANAEKGGGASTATDVPLIPVKYPGHKYNAAGAGSVNALEHGMADPAGRTQLMDPNAAANAIHGWSIADQRDFAKHAWYLGGIKSPDDLAGAWDLWQEAVRRAAAFSAAGNPMDPQDVLDLMLTGDPQAQRNRKMRADGGVVTQKSRSINVASAQEAKGLIIQAFKTAVGREPTDAELRTYTNSLQQAMKANPTVTTSSQKYDANGNAVGEATSTTTGGLDPQQFVADQLSTDPQAEEYQAAAVYFPALLAALGPGAGMASGG